MFSYKQNERSPNTVIIGATDGFSTSVFSSALLMSHEKRVVNTITARFKRVHNSPRYNATLQDQNNTEASSFSNPSSKICQVINYLIILLEKIKDLK